MRPKLTTAFIRKLNPVQTEDDEFLLQKVILLERIEYLTEEIKKMPAGYLKIYLLNALNETVNDFEDMSPRRKAF